MLKEKLKEFEIMIKNGIDTKSEFHPLLTECDKLIIEYCKSVDYTYEPPPNLFRNTTDDRLQMAINKKERLEKNPEVGIQEIIKSKLSIMHNFLEQYHIGYLREAKFTNSDLAEIEISCLIHKPINNGKDISEKIKLEQQIEFLKEKGFQINYKKYIGHYIENCETNHKLIHELISSRGGIRIKVSTINNEIKTIGFMIDVKNINNFKEDGIQFTIPISDKLNEDEKREIIKLSKEIPDTYSMIKFCQESMKNTCCSLMEHYFSDMCNIFNYNGNVSQITKSRYKEEREKNLKIREIEKEIGVISENIDIKKVMNQIQDKITEISSKYIFHYSSGLTIDQYGICTITFSNLSHMYLLLDIEPMHETALKSLFDTNGGSVKDETIEILDTYENKIKIEKILHSKIPTFSILDFKIGSQIFRDKKFYYIKGFTGIIDDISHLL